jgi:hypothetical protein
MNKYTVTEMFQKDNMTGRQFSEYTCDVCRGNLLDTHWIYVQGEINNPPKNTTYLNLICCSHNCAEMYIIQNI